MYHDYVLFVLVARSLVITRLRFEGAITVLIAPSPCHCILVTYHFQFKDGHLYLLSEAKLLPWDTNMNSITDSGSIAKIQVMFTC